MDAYDFAEPADVLGRLDKSFWEGLASAKWSERRNALQSLKQLASSPRLASGDYADVLRELRKVTPTLFAHIVLAVRISLTWCFHLTSLLPQDTKL